MKGKDKKGAVDKNTIAEMEPWPEFIPVILNKFTIS